LDNRRNKPRALSRLMRPGRAVVGEDTFSVGEA
jgi:hypothetical protein